MRIKPNTKEYDEINKHMTMLNLAINTAVHYNINQIVENGEIDPLLHNCLIDDIRDGLTAVLDKVDNDLNGLWIEFVETLEF